MRGRTLINAYELMDWDDPELVQFDLCEACGVVHCEPGGWISLRRIPGGVVILPAFGHYLTDRQHGQHEYGPPHFLTALGIPYIRDSTYEQLRSELPAFPSRDVLSAITEGEALRIFQFEAPRAVFGGASWDRPPEFSSIIAVSEGNVSEYTSLLKAVYPARVQSTMPARISPIPSDACVVSLFLDLPGISEWRAFVATDRKSLFLSDEHQLEVINDR